MPRKKPGEIGKKRMNTLTAAYHPDAVKYMLDKHGNDITDDQAKSADQEWAANRAQEFSRGQGVGEVPAQKTAKKAKSKKAATKTSKKEGGEAVWSADDHQYNQLFLARGADFLSSDRDGDGTILLSELWLASGRISVSTFRFEEVEEVFHLVDVDKNGVLDVTEYLNAISWLDTDGDASGS